MIKIILGLKLRILKMTNEQIKWNVFISLKQYWRINLCSDCVGAVTRPFSEESKPCCSNNLLVENLKNYILTERIENINFGILPIALLQLLWDAEMLWHLAWNSGLKLSKTDRKNVARMLSIDLKLSFNNVNTISPSMKYPK